MSALAHEIRLAVREEFRSLISASTLKDRRLRTIPEAAKYLTLSVRTLKDMLSRGELRRVRKERRVMLDVQDLDQWIEDHKE